MSEKDSGSINLGLDKGCTGCGCVLTVGLALATLAGGAIGGGCSTRIPTTESNITIAGSIGDKDNTRLVLPEYAQSEVGSSDNFINGSQTLTIGPAEGIQMTVIGHQEGAPRFDLDLNYSSE